MSDVRFTKEQFAALEAWIHQTIRVETLSGTDLMDDDRHSAEQETLKELRDRARTALCGAPSDNVTKLPAAG